MNFKNFRNLTFSVNVHRYPPEICSRFPWQSIICSQSFHSFPRPRTTTTTTMFPTKKDHIVVYMLQYENIAHSCHSMMFSYYSDRVYCASISPRCYYTFLFRFIHALSLFLYFRTHLANMRPWNSIHVPVCKICPWVSFS